MSDKLGTYVTKLMTTVLDKEQEQFVKDLALNELRRLNANIGEFLNKYLSDEMSSGKPEVKEKPCCAKNKCKKKEKQLLQEEKENVK